MLMNWIVHVYLLCSSSEAQVEMVFQSEPAYYRSDLRQTKPEPNPRIRYPNPNPKIQTRTQIIGSDSGQTKPNLNPTCCHSLLLRVWDYFLHSILTPCLCLKNSPSNLWKILLVQNRERKLSWAATNRTGNSQWKECSIRKFKRQTGKGKRVISDNTLQLFQMM